MTPVAAVMALALGLGMGMLGGGGSIVAVPLLTFVFGLSPKDAIVASLAIVALTAAAGVAGALVRGVLPVRPALIVGVSAVLGGLAGGTAGTRLADQVQLVLLAVVMFGAAVLMWRAPVRLRIDERPVGAGRLSTIGLATGFMTGLIGVGGGFLIVPALVAVAGLSMPRAAAASLFVITMASLSAVSRYASQSTVSWTFIAPFAAVAAAGALAGGAIAPRLPQRILQQAFAAALVILGSYVLFRA